MTGYYTLSDMPKWGCSPFPVLKVGKFTIKWLSVLRCFLLLGNWTVPRQCRGSQVETVQPSHSILLWPSSLSSFYYMTTTITIIITVAIIMRHRYIAEFPLMNSCPNVCCACGWSCESAMQSWPCTWMTWFQWLLSLLLPLRVHMSRKLEPGTYTRNQTQALPCGIQASWLAH